MTEQKPHYDEHIARYRTLSERYGFSPPDLTESVENHKTYYLICRIIYAIEDSLSFLFGNIKLFFSLMASYYQRSDAGSGDELHTSLQSLPDLLIILGLGIPLVVIQVLGAYFADSPDLNKNNFKYFFAKILAPYLRDILQGIKWAYKGMRSTLNMVFYFMVSHKALILKILFPLSIAVAVLSLLNRVFLRSLRNVRKSRQSDNRKASREIYEQGHVIKFRQEMPDDEKELKKLRKSLVYVPNDEVGCKIHYVNEQGEASEIELQEHQKKHISNMIKKFQSANIRYHLEPEFITEGFNGLIFLDKKPDDYLAYKNKLLFITDQSANNTPELIRVNENGEQTTDPRSQYFVQSVANVIKSKSALNLYSNQLDEIQEYIIGLDPKFQGYSLGLSIDEWDEIKNTKKPQTLSQSLIYWCFASVILSALIDGSYFYIGTIFMASFNPAGFIAMMAMASILLTVCLVARIYEEYSYQKAFNISQIEIALNKQKTELNILGNKLTEVFKNQDDKTDLESVKTLLNRYRSSLLQYNNFKINLESKVRISATEAFVRGLKNGLSAQGVISALMFVGATILVLTGTTCPPIFIISMTAFSLVLLVRSIFRYMQSYAEYKKIDIPLEKLTFDKHGYIDNLDEHGYIDNLEKAQLCFNSYKVAKETQEHLIIAQPPNLYEEENAEVLRLGCSGFSKWQKNFGECTLGEPRHGEDWWLTATSLGISGLVMWAFVERGKYKMFSATGDNLNIVANEGLTETQSPGVIGFFRQPSGEVKRIASSMNSNNFDQRSDEFDSDDNNSENNYIVDPSTSF